MFGTGESVVARWLREPFDLDGWRIDVANMTGRYAQHDHANSVARQIRATMNTVRPDTVLLAEHCHDAGGDLAGDGWQGTMNYAGFTRPVWSWLTSSDNGLGFLGMPVGIPSRSGAATMATMRDFAASIPWKVTCQNWNLLSSHDTPRFRTVTGRRELVEVGLGLQMTYVGSPMIFAGEELGFEGVDGEDSRRPIPWHRRGDWDHRTLKMFQDVIAVRQAHPALRRGGLRWLIAADDALGYLRETAQERILVVVSRAPWSGAMLPAALIGSGAPENLPGRSELRMVSCTLVVPGDGPGVGIWRLN
jgi:alpha-glucosidase